MNLAQAINWEAVCDGNLGRHIRKDVSATTSGSADGKAQVGTHVVVRGRKGAIIAHLAVAERGTMREIFDAVGLPNFEAHSVILAQMRKQGLITSSGHPPRYIYRLTAAGRAHG